jgi:Rod binding domain-containing protein
MVASVASATVAAGTGDSKPKNIGQAAQQFEAMLIEQMLKGAHEEGEGGWLGAGEDEAGSSMVDLAEENMAQAMASQGGMGLAGMVTSGFKDDAAAAKP